MSKHICPNCGGKRLATTAHVMQGWEVDEYGDFTKVLADCLEVVHRPDDGNIWTCLECGAIAEIVMEEKG